ncbi:uncharacterized protein TM35_000691110, partial [Trypanosoma theileri]
MQNKPSGNKDLHPVSRDKEISEEMNAKEPSSIREETSDGTLLPTNSSGAETQLPATSTTGTHSPQGVDSNQNTPHDESESSTKGNEDSSSNRPVEPPAPAAAPPTAPKGSVDPTGKNNAERRVIGAPGEQVSPNTVDKGDSNDGAGSVKLPSSEPENGSGEQRTTGESAGKAEGAEAEPTPSPTNSTQESVGDNNANAVNGTKPAEGGSPSNQESVGNTETTTT